MPFSSISRGAPARLTASPAAVKTYLAESHRRIDRYLEKALPAASEADGGIPEVMRYAALSPGKRIRPAVLMAVAESYGAPPASLPAPAAALELVHACSLILDDLPCMDDADERRGQPSSHRAFGEDKAILAAFGLLNLSYGILANEPSIAKDLRGEMAGLLSEALGTKGLIAGQALDLALSPDGLSLHALEQIHSRKTGSLFIASVEMGAVLGRAPAGERRAWILFAKNLGLAYQIVDDLLDVTSDAGRTGKTSQRDRRGNFVSLSGVEGARRLAQELAECALEQLDPLGERAQLLRGLVHHLTARSR
jgi:geranylgeranyl pyrophosphate synthase